MSSKKRKLSAANTSGYTGVFKSGKRFSAQIGIGNGKRKSLGTHDTAKEAALAYDRAVVQHKLPSSRLNYPDGLPNDGTDDDEIMNPTKKRKLGSNNTTGVIKSRMRFMAQIKIDGTIKNLGTHDTPQEAALAFDRTVVQHKLLPSSNLNFSNGLPSNNEDDNATTNATTNPKKKRRLHTNNTSGYTGVYKNRKKFQARIFFDSTTKSLGTYDTAKEAALAYDRAIIQHKLCSSKLNFPNDYEYTSSDEESDEDTLPKTSMLEQLACVAEQEFKEP